jgi:hypothetical protein
MRGFIFFELFIKLSFSVRLDRYHQKLRFWLPKSFIIAVVKVLFSFKRNVHFVQSLLSEKRHIDILLLL